MIPGVCPLGLPLKAGSFRVQRFIRCSISQCFSCSLCVFAAPEERNCVLLEADFSHLLSPVPPGVTLSEAHRASPACHGATPMPRDMAFPVPKGGKWHDHYDYIRY